MLFFKRQPVRIEVRLISNFDADFRRRQLEKAGMRTTWVDYDFGEIYGQVDRGHLRDLRAIRGVQSVRKSRPRLERVLVALFDPY